MQIEFIKDAVTLFGKVEKGDILNVSEQSALSFIQAGFAKVPAKKGAAKTKKAKTKEAAEVQPDEAAEVETDDV